MSQESNTPSTPQAWQALFEEVSNRTDTNDAGGDLLARNGGGYECPETSSPAFRALIDHTLLKVDATEEGIDRLCEEAWEWGFASVCVRPQWVKRCVENLARLQQDDDDAKDGHKVLVATVINFHEGTYSMEHQLDEITLSLHSGAHELDIVLNQTALEAQDWPLIHTELTRLRAAAPAPITLKLILETSHCIPPYIIAACTLACHAGFDYVKTSTGYSSHGARLEEVGLMREIADGLEQGLPGMNSRRPLGVKASGGIRDLGQARLMIEHGATRLGVSCGVKIAVEGGGVKR